MKKSKLLERRKLSNIKLLTLDARYRDSILGVAQQYGAHLTIYIGIFLAHGYIVALDDGHVVLAGVAVAVVGDFLGGNLSGREESGYDLQLLAALPAGEFMGHQWHLPQLRQFGFSRRFEDLPKAFAACGEIGPYEDLVEAAGGTLAKGTG